MTLSEFTKLFIVKYPSGRVVARGADYAGGRRASGLVVEFATGGRQYEYGGTFQSIAERLELLPVWIVVSSTGEQVARANSAEDAQALADKRTAEDIALCVKWGGVPRQYTIRQL